MPEQDWFARVVQRWGELAALLQVMLPPLAIPTAFEARSVPDVVEGIADSARKALLAVNDQTPQLSRAIDKRNQWFYEQRKAERTLKEIRVELGKKYPDWPQLRSDQAVYAAIKRHIAKYGLELLPSGSPGRPAKTKR
jgi:hypothetical protein